MSDSESSESEDEITSLNEETETVRPPDVALPSSEDGAALPSHQNQVALRSQEQQVAIPSNQGQLAGPSESEVTIMGGNFKKINLGPHTDKRKQVNKAYNYSNAKIEHHHHYYGDTEGTRESTPDRPPSGARRKVRTKRSTSGATGGGQVAGLDDGEDYFQVSEDIFMCRNKPLKKGIKVYKGYQQHASGHRRPLAIKVISPCEDANVREVELLLKLSHPNVVQIVHSTEHEGTSCRELYIAMELCSSQNLQDYINEKREKNEPLDFNKTMSLSKQLIKGMQHIHGNRVAHRDVKPQNLLFSLNGQQIKVSDFGISKEIRPGRSATQRTSHAEGTVGFASPETYLSDIISMSADIYSLAITLHILWSNGCHPFGVDPDLWIYNIKKNKGCDFSTLLFPEEMSTKKEEFVDLLDQMLQFDPKLRPTIDQVMEHPFFSKTRVLGGTVSVTDEASLENELTQDAVLQTTDKTSLIVEETIPKQEPVTYETSLETEVVQEPVLQTADKTFSTNEVITPEDGLSASVSIPTAAEPSDAEEPTSSASSHIDQPSLGAVSRHGDVKKSRHTSKQPRQLTSDTDADISLPTTGALSEETRTTPMKIKLSKRKRSFGFSIQGGKLDDPSIIIKHINPKGAASRDGRLKVGHQVLTINGQSMLGVTHDEAVQYFRAAGEKVTLWVCCSSGFVSGSDGTNSCAGHDDAVEPTPKGCEKAEALIKDSKFEEAISILEDLPPSQRQQLLLMDCFSQLRRDSQLVKCVETMQMLMTRHPTPAADGVYNLGDKYFRSQACIRALAFLSCASKLYKLDHTSNPDRAMLKIYNCSWGCCQVIRDMAEQGGRMRELAYDFGFYVVTQILADYRSIPNGDPDIKIKYECHCLDNIGSCYHATERYQKSIESYKLGIETMERHFGEKASSFLIFGVMIHKLAEGEFDLGNYIEAEKCFSKALKALELVEDFLIERDRKISIQQISDRLKDVRERLGKS